VCGGPAGGGGLHYLFRHDSRVKKRTRIRGLAIDSIAGNQPIVASPSLHHSGGRYRWRICPEEAEIAEAPDWLIGLVTSREDAGSTFVFEDRDLRTAPGAASGERNATLCRLVGSHLSREGVTPDLLQLATDWGLRCKPPISERDISRTVANLVAKHTRNGSEEEEDEEGRSESGELQAIAFSSIDPKPVDWLWPGRLALGKLSLLTGDGGVGKSILTCDLASRISRGADLPDGSSCPRGDTFFVGAEDGAEDTLRPRLDAAGAVADRVHLIRGPKPEGHDFATPVDLSLHIVKLDRLLAQFPEAKLLVIDPVLDYLGATCNSDKATDVRRVLSPLRDLAERRKIAVILMNHLRKAIGGSSKSRSLGSGAFVQVARFEFRVIEDPEDPKRRLFLPVKQNLGEAPGLAYRIESGPNGAGFAVWEADPVDLSIGEVESEQSGDDRGTGSRRVSRSIRSAGGRGFVGKSSSKRSRTG
jgi:putative DNA primase/helicase